MNKNIKYIFFFVFFILSVVCFAQQKNTDSLRSLLKSLSTTASSEFTLTVKGGTAGLAIDTIRINTLNTLAWELKNNNPDSSIIFSTQALNISLDLFKTQNTSASIRKKIEIAIAKSYNCLGAFNYLKGNYPISLEYYLSALKIRESLNDKKGISATLGNIGLVYRDQSNYPKALEYYFKALKIAEELAEKNLIAADLANIGTVYSTQTDYPKALDYYFKAMKITEELKGKNAISADLGNIGSVYCKQALLESNTSKKEILYNKTLNCYFNALKMGENLGDKHVIARHLCNIGAVYYQQAHEAKSNKDILMSDSLYKKTLTYYFKALKIEEDLGNKIAIAVELGSIGSLYTDTKRYKEAEVYLFKALSLSSEINALDIMKDDQHSLSELYEQIQEPDKALEHYKKYIAIKDSIFNEENTKKTVRSEMNFEFEKKQAIEKAEQEKQNEIAQQEKQKQKTILILISCFLMLVAIFASFMFNRWRITQKQKLIIEKQKEKIVDSITYAQLIQQSILIDESEIQKYLPDSFVYFQPKDIVSGDFYWFSKINDKIILAAVDCTGHGVPGAFMSMIGNTLLNQIVNEKQITKPSEILRLLNLEVIESLHQAKDGALAKDGMAIALCTINYSNNQIEYAGAENPLYLLSDNEITVINADRHGIGSGGLITKKKNPSTTEYTNHIIPIKKGMSVFIFSDGYMDQFGGFELKKFGIQKFKELLLNNQHLSMQQQKEIIVKAQQKWKGSLAQIDDILAMGLKL